MVVHDSDRGLGFLLTEAARLLRKLIDRRWQPLGLTRAQWSALAVLSDHDGLSQSQLADEIEKTTAGRLIDHIEKSAWIERRPIPGDRRLWGVHLTERARPLIAEVEQIVLDTRADMLRGRSSDQQRHLSEALRAVKTNLSKALEIDQADHELQQAEHTAP